MHIIDWELFDEEGNIRDDNGDPKLEFVKTGADHFAHSRTYSEIALPFAASISTGRDIKKFL